MKSIPRGTAICSISLQLQLDTFVRERALGAWHKLMDVFWKRFGRWCEKAIGDSEQLASLTLTERR